MLAVRCQDCLKVLPAWPVAGKLLKGGEGRKETERSGGAAFSPDTMALPSALRFIVEGGRGGAAAAAAAASAAAAAAAAAAVGGSIKATK